MSSSLCHYPWTYHVDFPNFSSLLPWVMRLYFFDFLKTNACSIFARYLSDFLKIEPNGSEHSKTRLLLEIITKIFQRLPEFSSQWASEPRLEFFKLGKLNFNDCFSFSLTWNSLGMRISKPYICYKLLPKYSNFSWIFLPTIHKTKLGIFEILVFNDFFLKISKSPLYCMGNPKNRKKPQLSEWTIV